MIWLVIQQLERRHRDVWILLVACLLASVGLTFILSTCYFGDGVPWGTAWRKQAQWLCLGLILAGVVMAADFRRLTGLVWGGYLGFVLLLVLTLLFGDELNGAKRWLTVPGLPRFQPAAPARLFTMLAYSAWLSQPPIRTGRLAHTLVGALIVLLPVGLILVEPAAGNAATLLFACMVIWLVHSRSQRLAKWLGISGLVVLLALVPTLHWVRSMNLDHEAIRTVLAKWGYDHHAKRIAWFLHPTGHPGNERQILLCLKSGGAFGKGLFRGDVQKGGFLPRGVAGSDFIIATVGEEAGFLGCFTVLMLCGGLAVLCVRVAEQSESRWGQLLCTGFAALFAVQVLISVGMTVRLFPIIGLTIPLLGQGGTLVATAFMGLGFVASVQRHSVPYTRCSVDGELAVIEPPLQIMHDDGPDTVVIELLPYGPMRLQMRFRYEGAAKTLEALASEAISPVIPGRSKRKRGEKQKRYDRSKPPELPGLYGALTDMRSHRTGRHTVPDTEPEDDDRRRASDPGESGFPSDAGTGGPEE